MLSVYPELISTSWACKPKLEIGSLHRISCACRQRRIVRVTIVLQPPLSTLTFTCCGWMQQHQHKADQALEKFRLVWLEFFGQIWGFLSPGSSFLFVELTGGCVQYTLRCDAGHACANCQQLWDGFDSASRCSWAGTVLSLCCPSSYVYTWPLFREITVMDICPKKIMASVKDPRWGWM